MQDTHSNLTRRRAAADAVIGSNEKAGVPAIPRRTSPSGKEGESWVPTVILAGHDEAARQVRKRLFPTVPKALGLIPKAGGGVYDIATLYAAKDKARAATGIVGGRLVGAAAGAAGGALLGPVGAVSGAVLGAVAGEAGAKRAYDEIVEHKDDIARALGNVVTRGWGGPAIDARARMLMTGR